jgi:hypothetical protein
MPNRFPLWTGIAVTALIAWGGESNSPWLTAFAVLAGACATFAVAKVGDDRS